MDKIDTLNNQTEITADEIINKIAKETNNHMEEQVLIGKIMRQNQKDVSKFVDELKKQQSYECSKEQLEYKNSLYYVNYLKILQSLDNVLKGMSDSILLKYYYNSMSYPNPFVLKHIMSTMFGNIGFPLPEFFYNEMLEIIKSKLGSYMIYPNLEFAVELKPMQYIKVGNIYRNYDAYMLNVELKPKEKQKTLV